MVEVGGKKRSRVPDLSEATAVYLRLRFAFCLMKVLIALCEAQIRMISSSKKPAGGGGIAGGDL